MITRAVRAIAQYLTGPIPADELDKVTQLKGATAAEWGREDLAWMKDEITRARLDRLGRRAGVPRA